MRVPKSILLLAVWSLSCSFLAVPVYCLTTKQPRKTPLLFEGAHKTIASILFCVSAATTSLPALATGTTTQAWTLGNGNVELPIPLSLGSTGIQLENPVLLGSGGGGAVFSMTTTTTTGTSSSSVGEKLAIKISWESTAKSVANECQMLQILQANHVSGVEQCIAIIPYKDSSTRTMIALKPVVEDPIVNSISELNNSQLQTKAVEQVVRTLLQMLHANVVTTDVQFLLSKTNGQILFLDLTEAQLLSQPPDFLQLALCNSFVSEMMAIIPDNFQTVASRAFETELNHLRENGYQLQPQIRDVLKEQAPFLSTRVMELLGE